MSETPTPEQSSLVENPTPEHHVAELPPVAEHAELLPADEPAGELPAVHHPRVEAEESAFAADAPASPPPASDPSASAGTEVDPPADPPASDQPIGDLITSALAPKLRLDDAEPVPPSIPDLTAEPAGAAPARPAAATNLDLPSLDLPHGNDYAATAAQAAYGQPQPTPQPQVAPQPPYTQPQYPPPSYAEPSAAGQQPTYGEAAYGQSPYGQPQYGQQLAPTSGLSPADESTWATAAHWSAIVASVLGLGFLGPLLVMLIQGPKSARVRANAVESLNFEITFIIAMVVSALLTLLLVGLVGLIAFPIAWLVLRIVASVQTSNGNDYRYPATLRLVK